MTAHIGLGTRAAPAQGRKKLYGVQTWYYIYSLWQLKLVIKFGS